MLQTKMAPPSAMLQPYVWSYGGTAGRIDSVPCVIPLPARPKQLLTFSFGEPYCLHLCGSKQRNTTPRVVVVGPQTYRRGDLSAFGRIDNFTIHFQPSGFNRLFGVPMTELTDIAYDAHAVIGGKIPTLGDELADTPSFEERIRLVEKHLVLLLVGNRHRPDTVAMAANTLFARNGVGRISTMAAESGLSLRQFERRFLEQIGVPPKLYARIIRFNAALYHKLQFPHRAWSSIANEQNYYDQMHLVHDFRAFAGDTPSQFLAQLSVAPEFHTAFWTHDALTNAKRRILTIRSHQA